MPRKKRLHFKDIDALRFFMILPALLFLSMLSIQPQGEGLTVEIAKASEFIVINSFDFFFFISAFLITSHALREQKYKNNFSLRFFLIRRIIRMLPLLLILLLFIFFFHPWIANVLKLFTFEIPQLHSYLMLTPNFFDDFNGEQNAVQAVTWLIFMFLQFFIIWGIILRLFITRILIISIFAIGLGVLLQHFVIANEWSHMFNTFAYITPIGFGGLLAKAIRDENKVLEVLKTMKKSVIVALYLLLIAHIIFGYLLCPKTMLPLIPFISGILFSLVIIEQTYGKNSPFKLRNRNLFTQLGKISLGFIVFHAIFSILTVIAVESIDIDFRSNFVKIIALSATFFMAWISADICYKFIETPIRRLKQDFKRE